MTLVASAARWNNAMVVSVIGGYDAFAHFTYIWFLSETGRVPLAESGWEFFQPPLYYAAMAAIWRALPELDGVARLRIGTALVATLGLAQAWVGAALVQRTFPREPLLQLFAAGLLLFVPVHLYSAGFLGNEGLGAALCALSLLALVRTLERPGAGRAALLGLALGLAMLTKFTGLVVVAAAGATMAAKAAGRRDDSRSMRALAIALTVVAVTSGWFYARNAIVYGNPFQMSREQLFLARVENSQLQGERRLLEYLLFDPGILYRPQWPRGLSVNSPRPPGVPYSALRESIPTGLYANTWFDGFGGFALPTVVESEAARRAGQLLLTLALVPTGLMLLGAGCVAMRLHKRAWNDVDAVVLASLAAMAVVLVHGTRSVPTQSAIKATYLMPVSVAFAYLAALGLDAVRARSRTLARAALAACALLAVASTLVFTRDLVLDTGLERGESRAVAQNLHGVIDYAAGDLDAAAEHFAAAARAGWHLGDENLAALAFERGQLERAEWFLSRAALRQPAQTRGTADERRQAISTTQAEYANSLAVIAHAAGRPEEAMRRARRAVAHDPELPEAHYDLGVLGMERALASAGGGGAGAGDFGAACEAVARSTELDPAFLEARRLRGVCLAWLGECDAARPWLDGPGVSPPGTRGWPVETGPGDLNAAGLHRRRHIQSLAEPLRIDAALARCPAG